MEPVHNPNPAFTEAPLFTQLRPELTPAQNRELCKQMVRTGMAEIRDRMDDNGSPFLNKNARVNNVHAFENLTMAGEFTRPVRLRPER